MPTFSYTAKSFDNQTKTGSREAASEGELARLLREEGLFLTSVTSAAGRAAKSKSNLGDFFVSLNPLNRISLMEKVLFTQHLAVMIGAGLSLNRALEALRQQTKVKFFANIISQVNQDINRGMTLADSLVKYPKVFSSLFVSMVRVGEASGTLEKVLRLLAAQMKKDHGLISKIRGAMVYPAVILIAMFGIGIAMMIFVVPQLAAVFKDINATLPITTQILIGVSDFLSRQWLISLLGLIILIFAARFFLRTKSGQNYFDSFILKMPIFGNISRKINSARLARTLGSLIESGVPITQGLTIVSDTLGNVNFRRSLQTAASQIQKGETLSSSIRQYPKLYPPMVGQMIEVGEETGTMGEILGQLAEFYEEEVDNITKSLASIIEPILMLIIGAAVGFFAVSMLQPMYSMVNAM